MNKEDTVLVIHCDACSYHKLLKNSEITSETLRASIPAKVPYVEKGKLINKSISQKKMLKCPNCGRGVTVRTHAVKKSVHKENEDGKENNSK